MSNAAIAWSLQQPTGSSGTRQLLMVLADVVSDKPSTSKYGRTWPAYHAYLSIAALVERTLQDRKTVIANLKRLDEGGFIRRAGTDGATNQLLVWYLPVPNSEPAPNSEPVPKHQPVPELEPVPTSTASGTAFPVEQSRFSASPVPKAVPENQGNPREPKEESKRAAARSASRKERKTGMPSDFGVSERVKQWAGEKGYGQLEEHLEAFIRKARARGYTYVDWDAAFMEAIREDWAKLRGRSATGAAPPPEDTGPRGPDPALLKIEEDRKRAVAPSAEIRERIKELRSGAPMLGASSPEGLRRRATSHTGLSDKEFCEGLTANGSIT